ncbi:MAG: plastocyanin/azurin family copper-binding protein [Opitutaceae bacterium]
MKIKSLLILFATGLLTVSLAAAEAAKTVAITASDNLRFSVTEIKAAPGESLHIQLHNVGTMPKDVMGHNWILLVAGENPDTYAAAALSAKAENYEPPALKAKVLAAIALLGPGETGDVTFTAPTVPGKYPFLCSFPAHCAAGMRGVLVVK